MPTTTEDPLTGDAFGEALLEEHNHGGVFEVAERDDGFIDAHPMSRYFAEPGTWPLLEAGVVERCRGRVLDLGAGAGRVALHLQTRGIDTLAVDNSPAAIEVCRRRGVENTMLGTLFDIQTPDRPFHTILMLGGNLAHLQNPQAAQQFLDSAAALSLPGAQLLGSSTDPYLTERPEHLRYYARNRAAGRLGGELTLRVRHRNRTTPWFRYWLASIPELEHTLTDTPWELTDVAREGARYLATLTLTRTRRRIPGSGGLS